MWVGGCLFVSFLSSSLYSSLTVVSIPPVYLLAVGGLFCFGFNISCQTHPKKKSLSPFSTLEVHFFWFLFESKINPNRNSNNAQILQREVKENHYLLLSLFFYFILFPFFMFFFFFFLHPMKCQKTRIKIDTESMFESQSSGTKMMQTPLLVASRSTNCCRLL